MRLTVYLPPDSPATHESVGAKLTIGRLGDNDVQLDEGSVSSRHAEICSEEGGVVLRDLGSTNGTFLNGEQVTADCPLKEGDEICFGGVRAVFMEPASGPSVPSPGMPAGAQSPGTVPDASGTGAPANFRPLSPLPSTEKRRDALALASWSCLGLGVAAALYALFVVLSF